MQHEIIMPALGMAQKTGLIVAWHKSPGDAVKASDILLDVETDKSTMEVEAGHDGYVAALMAGAGEDVPVGTAIALISSEKPDLAAAPAKEAPAAAAPPAQAEKPAPAPVVSKPAEQPAAAKSSAVAPVSISGNGKILASPKAKRLAAERGIDLGRLVALGRTQPFHVADLDTLPPVVPAAAVAALSEIEARVEPAGLAAMLGLLTAEGATDVALWAAFAASSLRAATERDAPILVRVEKDTQAQFYADPDRAPLSRLAEAETAQADIVIHDFTGTCLLSTRLAGETAPVLSLTGDAERMTLRLAFDSSRLPPAAAAAFVKGFAARLVDPLRQLL